MSLTAAERLIVQALILSDATAFDGADIAAILADTVTIAAIIADIGVFPTANYATLAAYVEDVRTRLINILTEAQSHPTLAEIQAGDMATILADIAEGKLRSFSRTYAFVTTNQQTNSAAEINLTPPAVVTVTFPAGATLLEARVEASIKASNESATGHSIKLTLQKNVAAGGWVDIRDLTAPPLGLTPEDMSTDDITIVEALTIATGQTVQFRWQVDSNAAGIINYTCTFVLNVEYDFQ